MKNMDPTYRYQYVMLIDDVDLDNFINEKLILLHHFSKYVYICSNAEEALEKLALLAADGINYPQIIFIDINMPMVNGFQFIAAFKKTLDLQLQNPKLAILTSSVFERDKDEASELSKDIVFLNKPLSKEIFDSL